MHIHIILLMVHGPSGLSPSCILETGCWFNVIRMTTHLVASYEAELLDYSYM